STAAGVITKVHVKVGDKVNVGQRLLSVSSEAAAAPAKAKSPQPAATKAKATATEPEPEPEAAPETEPAPEEPAADGSGAPVASPAIRRLARELKLDLTRVRGSARGGRITMEDLAAYIQ